MGYWEVLVFAVVCCCSCILYVTERRIEMNKEEKRNWADQN